MRFILTAFIWIAIVGGLWLYTQQRQQVEASIEISQPHQESLQQHFELILTPTFTIEPDPFALQVTDEPDTAIELRVNGQQLEVAAASLQRGIPLVVADIKGLVAGQNEIYVQASPPIQESWRNHGMRVQLKRTGIPLLDSTIWAGEGARVVGTVNFALDNEGDTAGTGVADEH